MGTSCLHAGPQLWVDNSVLIMWYNPRVPSYTAQSQGLALYNNAPLTSDVLQYSLQSRSLIISGPQGYHSSMQGPAERSDSSLIIIHINNHVNKKRQFQGYLRVTLRLPSQ
ncbi:hypothetical protein PAXRUDRAFT_229114 [Paxillus rubicundulus Ve08.2h10]|uniref:Uncharacterized protein n=1 Tax=Paxillus rubicundulus Ve08.2h10 TaxID=930991 RepID=A0A0D0DP44_9AGAM|nr:hypothetical protein PAXRUDRAFT_229114 [Paxillus rubicundulus Ve08.2h10]